MNKIKKPFRFLKNLMRWYERESDNILKQVRSLEIKPDLWIKAEHNFNKRGLPIPMYENHNSDKVVGEVYKIKAKEDGLYVEEHSLNERGLELVKNKEYPLPSGDFVLHYDSDDNVVDLEVIGVSLVNSEGAKDVQLVSMSKEGILMPLDRVKKINQNKGAYNMELAEIVECLQDEEVLKQLPDDIVQKIVSIANAKTADNSSSTLSVQNTEGTNKDDDNADNSSSNADDKKDSDTANKEGQNKDNDTNDTNDSEKSSDSSSSKDATGGQSSGQNKDDDTNDDDEKTKSEDVAQSKFNELVAEREALKGGRISPKSYQEANKFIKRNYAQMGKKAITMAIDNIAVFYGERSVENATMGKEKDKTIKEIAKSIFSV